MPKKREPAPQSRTIRVDMEVFAFLQKQATPFQDSPNDVLRRFFGMDPAKPKTDNYDKAMAREERTGKPRGFK